MGIKETGRISSECPAGLSRLLACAALSLGMAGCSDGVQLGPGQFAPASPKQWTLEPSSAPVAMSGFTLAPKAGYQITAKVLSKRRYRWDDLATVAAWDFALGWGPMSDEAIIGRLKVVQGDRFMFWHLYDAPIDINLVNQLSANVHLIAANESLFAQFEAIPRGAIVSFTGELVDVHFPDQSIIPSSLTRRDTGPGACEILLVHKLEVIDNSHERVALKKQSI